MTASRWQIAFLAISSLTLTMATGCVSNAELDDLDTIPQALDDAANGTNGPGSGIGYNLTGGGQWADGANGSLGGTAADGSGAAGDWQPVSPDNLGFPIIYFDYDTDVLAPSETAKLDQVAQLMMSEQCLPLGLIVEGYCDERGTDEYNRALGDRRANSIRAYLTQAGIDDTRIRTVSYGEDRPAVEGTGEAVWKQNRRAVLVPARMQ